MKSPKPKPVPKVDIKAPLKIEKVKEAGLDIPQVKKDAPLKIEKSTPPPFSENSSSGSSRRLFSLGTVTLLIIVLLTAGFILFLFRLEAYEAGKRASADLSTPAAEATPKPEFSPSDISLEVLNG